MFYNFIQFIVAPILLQKFSKSSIVTSIVLSFTNGCAYNFKYDLKFMSKYKFTSLFMPLIIAKGLTAPGRTPKFSNNLSFEPNESLPALIISLTFFKSIFLSC